MPARADLEQFIIERMQEWDSDVDVSEGSSFRQQVIEPILDRLSGDPLDLETDIETFIVDTLKAYDPEIAVEKGTAIYDLLIAPLKLLFEPLKREIYHAQRLVTLADYASLTKEEMDALASNFFISRRKGEKASTIVRVYFTSPRSVIIYPTARFYTADGLNFYPKGTVNVSEAEMSLNVEGSLYYMDVEVEAEEPGTKYRVPRGAIVGVDGFSGYARVINPDPVINGLDEETNEELYERVRSSLTERTPTTERGIKTLLMENFSYITKVKVVGAMDPEMTRDRIYILVPGASSTGATGAGPGVGAWIKTGNKVDVYVGTRDISIEHVDLVPATDEKENEITLRVSYNPNEVGENLINLPVVRVLEVRELNLITGAETGRIIPPQRPIDCRALYSFSGGEIGTKKAGGIARIFFDRPTKFQLTLETKFVTEDGLVFYPQNVGTFESHEARPGQNIAATELDTYREVVNSITYYYVDIMLIAESPGAAYNVAEDTQFRVENFNAEGWRLESSDTAYAFSAREGLSLVFSPTYNDGDNYTCEAGFRVYYQTSQTIRDAQDFLLYDENRVVVADVLVKSFRPLYFSAHVRYEGSIEDTSMLYAIQDYILGRQPGETFVVSDFIHYLHAKGATRIDLPLTMFLIEHQEDRTLKAVRFDDEYDIPKNCEIMIGNLTVEKLG